MNFFNTILTSWKESLQIFLSQNFKGLFLVSIKSITNLFQIILFIISVILISPVLVNPKFISTNFLALIASITLTLFINSIRSSINYKNFFYYSALLKPVFPAIRTIVLVFMFFAFFVLVAKNGLWTILLPLLIFIALFLFDSEQTLKDFFLSIGRGCLMYVYNLPYCILITIGYFLFLMTLLPIAMFSQGIMFSNFFKSIFSRLVFPSIWIVSIMIYIALNVSFYIKRVHDQYLIYFKEKNN